MMVPIPALFSINFNHPATVDEDTGLCNLIIAINNWVLLLAEHSCAVLLSYSWSAATGAELPVLIEPSEEELLHWLRLLRLFQILVSPRDSIWFIATETFHVVE